MTPKIPIQNLYFIFCYAWNRIEEGQAVAVGGTASPEIADLFATVLINGTKHLLRRGIDRGYVLRQEDLSRLRGRIQLTQSFDQISRRTPRLFCEFDELQKDVLHNQILKSTIARLSKVNALDPRLAHELRLVHRQLDDISEVRLSRSLFHQVQIHRNNAYYDFLLKVCELVFEVTLPESGGDRYRFTEFLRDERKMARVFEDFVRNFYRLEQNKFDVLPLQLNWDATADIGSDLGLLPVMRTDVHLRGNQRNIIIDTKYYGDAFQEHFGKVSIRSENLYQLFSYVKNAEAHGSEYSNVEGMLLYPAVDESIDARFVIQGHAIQVRTIDLDQPWPRIRRDLLDLLYRQERSQSALA